MKVNFTQLDQSELFVSLCFLPGKVYPSGVTFTTSNNLWNKALMWAAWNVDHLTLDVSFSSTDIFKNSFFVRICRLWNELPLSIRESNTLSIFRKNLMAFYHDKFNVDFFNFNTVLYQIISPFIIILLISVHVACLLHKWLSRWFYYLINSVDVIIGGLFLRSLVFCFKPTSDFSFYL